MMNRTRLNGISKNFLFGTHSGGHLENVYNKIRRTFELNDKGQGRAKGKLLFSSRAVIKNNDIEKDCGGKFYCFLCNLPEKLYTYTYIM